MTPKIILVLLISCSLFEYIVAASFSNVLVKSGSDFVPFDFINYGGAVLPLTRSQIAQLSAPLDPLVPVPSLPAVVSPCVSPCVIPNVPAVAPVSTSGRIVTYKSPVAKVPVITTSKDDTVGYQYAYSVFDDNTGDKKTQSEQSDGSVVQGQYSFIQPDGVRREVSYTADDLNGFNAVVRNITPAPPEKPRDDAKNTIPPCNEIQNAQLQDQSSIESIDDGAQVVDKVQAVTASPDSSPEVSSTDAPGNTVSDDAVVPYNDVIKCLQAKLQAGGNQNFVSPLTFILLPSFVGGCQTAPVVKSS